MSASPDDSPTRVLLIGSSSKWRIVALQQYFKTNSTSPADEQNKTNRDDFPRFNTLLTLSPDIDEKTIRRESPEDLCVAIAEAKMDKILSLLQGSRSPADGDDAPNELVSLREMFVSASKGCGNVQEFWILTGDQVAVYNGMIREKPVDRDENVTFLQSYRGSHVDTVAGTVLVRVVCSEDGERCTLVRRNAVNHTRTAFRCDLPDDVICRVIDRGDSMHCCGGFVVDDVELASFIESVEPSLQAVTGLDMTTVAQLMRDVLAATPRCL